MTLNTLCNAFSVKLGKKCLSLYQNLVLTLNLKINLLYKEYQ